MGLYADHRRSAGCGKSTFLTTLGKDWFCDSLEDFSGKEAAEIIQGQWIIEVGELAAMNRAETNAIKQFLSKKDDVYRAAYGDTLNATHAAVYSSAHPMRRAFCET